MLRTRSIFKELKVNDMNRYRKKISVRVRPFSGAMMKQLEHYIIPTLTDDTPNTIIIQGECNDVSDKNSNREDIANATGSLGNLCRSLGVNQVLVSLLNCRKNIHLNNKVKRINFYVSYQENGFIFIKTITSLPQIYGRVVSIVLIEINHNFVNHLNNFY